VLEAVLWILNTGAQWHMLPQSYPNYKTVHRRFQDDRAAPFQPQ
jgi:transposase